MNKIDSFRDEYYFLSNFSPSKIRHNGMVFPTVEHAYQAMKIDPKLPKDQHENWLAKIAGCETPGKAKAIGKTVPLMDNWDQYKVGVMFGLLWQKFEDPTLRKMLLDTGDAELIEGNWWGDRFWGVCGGRGENWLGKHLMEIRDRIKDDIANEFEGDLGDSSGG